MYGIWLLAKQVQGQVIFRLTISRPVRLGVEPPLGPMTRFRFSLFDNYFLSSSCRAPSLTKWRVCSLQCNHSQVRVAQDPTWWARSSHPHLPMNRVVQSYPRTLGSLLVTSSTRTATYGGGILIRLHMELLAKSKSKSHYDRQIVGQSVLVSGGHLGPATNFSISLRFSFRQLLFVML
jgi:hypothetical protein